MNKPKVAIIRGPYLNPYEMQNYAPLKTRFWLKALKPTSNFFKTDDIDMPIQEVKTWESTFGNKIGDYFRLILHFPWGWYHAIFGLDKALSGANIVHTVEAFQGFSYQAAKLKRKLGFKLVVTVWENIPFAHENLLLFPKIKRTVYQEADLFLAITDRAKQALVLEGVDPKKIMVQPMGINLAQFKPTKPDLKLIKLMGMDKTDKITLFVGRLTYEKGLLPLLAGYRLFLNSVADASNHKLLILGAGPSEKKIWKLAERLEIDDHIVISSVDYRLMPKVYSIAQCLILPSIPTRGWQEQFGMTLVEAMACGLPVISTLSGSIPEVVGDAGILIQPDDSVAVAESLADIHRDKKLAAKLSKLGLARAKKYFDAKLVAKNIGKMYDRLLNS